MRKIVITGGAGFIGTQLCRRLLDEGLEVSVLDNFSQQVHADNREMPADLKPHVRLVQGDVCDMKAVSNAVEGQDVLVHFAAETGTGQSMYEVRRYEEVNIAGTAALMHYLVNSKNSRIAKVIVASSRAVYGEGLYECGKHGRVSPNQRRVEDMRQGQFEPTCPTCSQPCVPVPTLEDAPLKPMSFYALTKQVQEQMTLLFAQNLGINAYALRFQNVYGPGQSLTNPYTGILAIFSNLSRRNDAIRVFEDGKESRDFVYIDDVVEATWKCVTREQSGVEIINVGSGVRTTVAEVVQRVISFFESQSEVRITGEFRQGDIRHNYADLRRAKDLLGFAPKWSFAEGVKKFLEWADTRESSTSMYGTSLRELRERGLLHG